MIGRRRSNSALRIRGKKAEAIDRYRVAIVLQPRNVDLLNTLGILLEETGKPAEAVETYRQALAIDPKSSEIQSNLGVALIGQGLLGEGEAAYREAIRLKPTSAAAHNNLATCSANAATSPAPRTLSARRFASIPAIRRRTTTSASSWPSRQVRRRIASYRQSLDLRPDYPEARNNLGILLADQHRTDEALVEYAEAIRLRPDYAEAHLNRALTYLVTGDFARGWSEYEWRWQPPLWKGDAYVERRWTGGPLDEKTILFRAEQGLGDTIQFVRFAAALKKRWPSCRIAIECQEPIAELLSTCPSVDRAVVRGSGLPDFDYQTPLLSIPASLGSTSVEEFGGAPYLFPNPEKIASWKRRVDTLDGLRVGLAWQGNPGYKGTRTARSGSIGSSQS